MFSYLSLASPLTVCGTSLCLRPTSFGILLSGLKRTPGICPSFNPKYIPSARARISGNQLELAEPGLGGRASMSTEQVKCSCGSMSSKAAPSIKLNKRGSSAAINSACSWRQTPLRHALFLENLPFHFSHSRSSPPVQTPSSPTVPHRHAKAGARARGCPAGLSGTNPTTSAWPKAHSRPKSCL